MNIDYKKIIEKLKAMDLETDNWNTHTININLSVGANKSIVFNWSITSLLNDMGGPTGQIIETGVGEQSLIDWSERK